MGKKASAIGFAVYLDKIERYGNNSEKFDVDTFIVYDASAKYELIIKVVEEERTNGKSVKIAPTIDSSIKCRELLKITERGVELLERND